MDRTQRLLENLDTAHAVGIEIGALDKPVVPPSAGHIFYVDHAGTEALRVKFKDDPNVTLDNIVDVSGVWGEKSLCEAAAAVVPVDYVVASHVIEHVPDLITWLDEIRAVLKPGGELRLAIPDKRYSFDVLRCVTQPADVLSAYIMRARVPQLRAVIDHVLNIAPADSIKLWSGEQTIDDLKPLNPFAAAEAIGLDVRDNGTYHDVHCWVFTPLSFVQLMTTLARAGHLFFECVSLVETQVGSVEFFATLRRCETPDQVTASWVEVRRGLSQSQ